MWAVYNGSVRLCWLVLEVQPHLVSCWRRIDAQTKTRINEALEFLSKLFPGYIVRIPTGKQRFI
jgi:hypothetical protein